MNEAATRARTTEHPSPSRTVSLQQVAFLPSQFRYRTLRYSSWSSASSSNARPAALSTHRSSSSRYHQGEEEKAAATQTTPRIPSTIMSCDKNNDSNNGGFPKHGIRLSYIINEFIPKFLTPVMDGDGGLMMTTSQVCETIIKPITEPYQSSYCQMLLKESKAPVDVSMEPTIFVSHAHCYLFLDVLNALEYHLRDNLDTYIWFDLFSINQHPKEDKDSGSAWTFDWLATTFQSAIGQFGKVVMIMSPWNDPIPYARSWCVFEAYCAVVTGSQFEIALSKKDEQQFLQDLKANGVQNSIDQMIATISSKDSQCHTESDKKQIFAVIQEQIGVGGFSKLDSMVLEQYRQWVIKISLQVLNEMKQKLDDDTANRNNNKTIAWSKDQHGDHCNNSSSSRQNNNNNNNNNNIEYLSMLLLIAELYEGQGELVSSEKYLLEYQDLLSESFSSLSSSNPEPQQQPSRQQQEQEPPNSNSSSNNAPENGNDVLAMKLLAMNNLARVYKKQYKFKLSLDLYQDCLSRRKDVLGPNHVDTLTTMNDLGDLYSHSLVWSPTNNYLQHSNP